MTLINHKEMLEVVSSPRRETLFIGGKVIESSKELILLTGGGEVVFVPLSLFSPSGDGTVPEFSDFSIEDYGNTLRFGNYEAANDAIWEYLKTTDAKDKQNA